MRHRGEINFDTPSLHYSKRTVVKAQAKRIPETFDPHLVIGPQPQELPRVEVEEITPIAASEGVLDHEEELVATLVVPHRVGVRKVGGIDPNLLLEERVVLVDVESARGPVLLETIHPRALPGIGAQRRRGQERQAGPQKERGGCAEHGGREAVSIYPVEHAGWLIDCPECVDPGEGKGGVWRSEESVCGVRGVRRTCTDKSELCFARLGRLIEKRAMGRQASPEKAGERTGPQWDAGRPSRHTHEEDKRMHTQAPTKQTKAIIK